MTEPLWNRVRAWRDLLSTTDPFGDSSLSPQGLSEAVAASVEALDDASLTAIEAMEGRPFPKAVFVAAATVATAPIEWCAVLLGRGSAVTLKTSSRSAGLTEWLVTTAQRCGLPLSATSDRAVVADADLVVAMGSDDTVSEIRNSLPASTRFLPHGHRFSVAWIQQAADDAWDALAADAALHDGRGCLSPTTVFSPLAADVAGPALQRALDRAALRWPIGRVDPSESAELRTRAALTRVAGRLFEGPGGSVHAIPGERWRPGSLPRSLWLIQAKDIATATDVLGSNTRWLSTVGTDTPGSAEAWFNAGATRVCPLGRMQRPPLLRSHDGEDWLTATHRSCSREV